jgi:hypothetical protein
MVATSPFPDTAASGSLHTSKWRRWAALMAVPIAIAVPVAMVTVELALAGDLRSAAIVTALWLAAQAVGSMLSLRLVRLLGGPRGGRWLTAWVVLVTAATLVVFDVAPQGAAITAMVMSVLVGFSMPALYLIQRLVAGSWGGPWIRRATWVGRPAMAVSTALVTALAIAPVPVTTGAIVLTAAFLGVSFTRQAGALGVRSAGSWSWAQFSRGGALAVAGSGPVYMYTVLIAVTAGPVWTGMAMTAYAVGALLAPLLARKVRWARSERPAVWVLFGAVTVLAWALVPVPQLLGWAAGWTIGFALAVRVLSGALMLAAEGSADHQAIRSNTLAASLAGRTVLGTATGAAGALALAVTEEFWAAWGVFALCVVVAAVGVRWVRTSESTVDQWPAPVALTGPIPLPRGRTWR